MLCYLLFLYGIADLPTADATPGALTAHTRDRGQYGHVIDSYYQGLTDYPWTEWTGPDVLFGGGAENFIAGEDSYKRQDYYKLFADKGYSVSWNKTALLAAPPNVFAFCETYE